MADDEKKADGGNGAPKQEEEGAGSLPAEPPRGAGEPEEGEDEPERQKITLDRYLGSRRRAHTGWGQLVILLFMLATLVLLMMYKDRCGDSVSSFIFMGGAPDGAPAVRIKLEPGEAKKLPPASQPARR